MNSKCELSIELLKVLGYSWGMKPGIPNLNQKVLVCTISHEPASRF